MHAAYLNRLQKAPPDIGMAKQQNKVKCLK